MREEVARVGKETTRLSLVVLLLLVIYLIVGTIIYDSGNVFMKIFERMVAFFPFWVGFFISIKIINMIGVKLMYKKRKWLVFLIPLLSPVFCYVFIALGIGIVAIVDVKLMMNSYGLFMFVCGIFTIILTFILSAIFSIVIYKRYKGLSG